MSRRAEGCQADLIETLGRTAVETNEAIVKELSSIREELGKTAVSDATWSGVRNPSLAISDDMTEITVIGHGIVKYYDPAELKIFRCTSNKYNACCAMLPTYIGTAV